MARIARSVEPTPLEPLARIRDPQQRLVAIAQEFERLARSQEDLSRMRAAAMAELCAEGMSLAAIGEAAGVTRGRVSQILKQTPAEEPRSRPGPV